MIHGAIPALLLAALSDTGPDAVVLTSSTSVPAAASVAAEVDAFLRERIPSAWGLEALPEIPAEAGGRVFRIHLTWPEPEKVNLRIQDGGEVLVDRSTHVSGSAAAKAMVWLLVRSTIERVLLQVPQPKPPPPDPVPEIAEAPAEVTLGEAPDPPSGVAVEAMPEAKDDWWDPPAPEPEAEVAIEDPSPAESEPKSTPAPVAASPTETSSAPKRSMLARLFTEKMPWQKPTGISGGFLMRAYAGPNGATWGPAVQVRMDVTEWFAFGGELAFREETLDGVLDIRHMPFTLFAGLRPLERMPIELGVQATADIKAISSTRSSGVGFGFLTGGYARADFQIYDAGTQSIALLADVGVSLALLRQSYLVNGTRTSDSAIVFQTGLGVEWRWR